LAARINWFAIHDNGAGSTLAAIATNLGTSEIQHISKHLNQSPPIFYLNNTSLTINC
jgi:hypothetical protein